MSPETKFPHAESSELFATLPLVVCFDSSVPSIIIKADGTLSRRCCPIIVNVYLLAFVRCPQFNKQVSLQINRIVIRRLTNEWEIERIRYNFRF